jgi:hypothetical protein
MERANGIWRDVAPFFPINNGSFQLSFRGDFLAHDLVNLGLEISL